MKYKKGRYSNLPSDLVNLLAKKGLKHLDSGSKADVFQTSDTTVVKVFYKDNGYLSFVEFVKQHPNKHLPKITLSAKLEKGILAGYYIAKLEKLKPVTINQISKTGIIEYITLMRNKAQAAMQYGKQHVETGNYGKIYSDMTKEQSSKIKDKKLLQLLDQLLSWAIDNKFVLDLHYGNFMKRVDGTIVIIDPFV